MHKGPLFKKKESRIINKAQFQVHNLIVNNIIMKKMMANRIKIKKK